MSDRGLLQRVLTTIQARRLWKPGHRVAVAVSGGVDSMVLLDLLSRGLGQHQGRLSVVTVDHGVRPTAAEDVALVRAVATAHGLPVFAAKLAGVGDDEASLRAARYGVFERLDADRVVLAHHQDDQAETVLLRGIRGSINMPGAGMAWRRGRYVRPLLGTPRADLVAWALRQHIKWREDPSNQDLRYQRNRVRAEVLPVLEQIRPGATRSLARQGALARQDAEYLASLALKHPAPWLAAWVANGPWPVVRRALRQAVPEAAGGHLDAIRENARRGRGVVQIAEHTAVVVEAGHVIVRQRPGGEA